MHCAFSAFQSEMYQNQSQMRSVAGHGLSALITVNAVHHIVGFTVSGPWKLVKPNSFRNVYTFLYLISEVLVGQRGSLFVAVSGLWFELTWEVDRSKSEHCRLSHGSCLVLTKDWSSVLFFILSLHSLKLHSVSGCRTPLKNSRTHVDRGQSGGGPALQWL